MRDTADIDLRAVNAVRREYFLAELGTQSLSGRDPQQLFDCACRELADLLTADYVKVLRLEGEVPSLRLVAGIGWQEGVVGDAVVSTTRSSQAGYTLHVDAPVLVDDLATETRFSGPSLLVEHGVRGGISAPIHKLGGTYGVLGVHTRRRDAYSLEDTHFLLAVANVLGAAVTSAEQRLAEQRAADTMRVLFEESSDLVVLVDPDAKIVTINPAVTRALAYSPEELVGQSAFDFIHPDDLPAALSALARLLTSIGGDPITLEARIRAKHGAWRDLEAVGRAVEAGRTTRIVINARDVTERRALEQQVRRSQQLETVGSLAAGVAHDLNNVLQAVLGSASYIEEATVDTTLREEARQIAFSADLAGRFLRGLLLLAHESKARPQQFELNSVIETMRPLLDRLLHAHTALHVTPTSMPTTILADVAEIEQIILNLVVNARDSMPRGGPISIATWVARTDGGPRVVLSVADRGVGIIDKVKRRMFEPLFTTKLSGKGTGLGLTIVAALARRSAATISVTSEPGVGSTFELAFPLIES